MTPTTPSPISDQAAGEPIVWKLVPERPTDAMMVAAWKLWEAPGDRQFNVWRAMLAAAPTAPTTGSAPVAYEWEAYNDYTDARPHWETCYGEPWWPDGEQPKHIRNVRALAYAAPARPAASALTDEQIRHLRVTLGLLNRMGYPDEAETIVALLAASMGGDKS